MKKKSSQAEAQPRWAALSAIDDYYFAVGGPSKRICRVSVTAILLGLGMAIAEPILGSQILRELFLLLSAALQTFGFLTFLTAKVAGYWAGTVPKIDVAFYVVLYFAFGAFVMTNFPRP